MFILLAASRKACSSDLLIFSGYLRSATSNVNKNFRRPSHKFLNLHVNKFMHLSTSRTNFDSLSLATSTSTDAAVMVLAVFKPSYFAFNWRKSLTAASTCCCFDRISDCSRSFSSFRSRIETSLASHALPNRQAVYHVPRPYENKNPRKYRDCMRLSQIYSPFFVYFCRIWNYGTLHLAKR